MSCTYADNAHCTHCGRTTPHTIYDAGHERDSSGDWQECQVCGWRWSGLTGEYEAPEGELGNEPTF